MKSAMIDALTLIGNELGAVGRRSQYDALVPWAEHYLPHYLTAASSSMHRWLATRLQLAAHQRGQKVVGIGPRGHAKSTWGTLVFPLYAICEVKEPFIVLLGDTSGQADAYLDAIRHELTNNALLTRDYPTVCGEGPVWNTGRIRTRNGCEVLALGTGKKIRGRRRRQFRPTLVVCDDPEGLEAAYSPEQRSKTRDWWARDVERAGSASTNFVLLGTVIHQECLVKYVAKRAGWESKQFNALLRWPARMDLWEEWARYWVTDVAAAEAHWTEHRAEMERGAKVLWPEVFPLLELMKAWAEEPFAFMSEMQGEGRDPAKCEWPDSYFEGDIWYDETPEGESVLALDPSKGANTKRGDYQAIVRATLVDKTYYLEADIERRPIEAMCRRALLMMQEHSTNELVSEENMHNGLLEPELLRVAEELGIHATVVPLRNTERKAIRIRRLGPLLARKRCRFKARSPGTALLVRQLQDYGPQVDHDDGPDAMEMAVRAVDEQAFGGVNTGGVQVLW